MSINNQLEIRNIKNSDKPILAEMYCRLNTETFHWMPQGSFTLSDFEKDTLDEKILVAALGEVILGFVSLKESENLIHQLYVDTNTQGQSIGKKLLNEIISIVKQRPLYLHCRVKNEHAFNFYKKYGFRLESEFNHNSDVYYKLVFN